MSIKEIFPSAALPEAREGGKEMLSKKKDRGRSKKKDRVSFTIAV